MKTLLFTICFGFCAAIVSAQNKVTGSVIAEIGHQPLAGATIKLKGSNRIAIASHKGVFSIPVPDLTDTLQVSFIGYKSKDVIVRLPINNPLVIMLSSDSNQLREVLVSTGYQDISKERSTGSFSQIDNKTFNQQVSTDILSRLEAVANGLTVDRKTNSPGIMIRGLSTIQGVTGPLIILDHFPYDGDINNINPNDVESITLLKDAASASIWGTKAGNGVIVITTKKGKYNQPLTIGFNSNIAVGQKPDLSYFRQMSSADYISIEKMLFGQGFYDANIASPFHPGLSPAVEILLEARNGSISAASAKAQLNILSAIDSRKDFDKYIYQPLFNQQYALNLQAGSDQYSWSASGGYDDNINNLAEKYNRLNLHYQNKVKLNKFLELSSSIYYTKSNDISGKLGYGDPTYGHYPYLQLANNTGNLPVARDYSLSYLATAGNGKLEDWKYYPLSDYKQDVTTINTQDVIANFGLNYHVLNGLNTEIKYQYENQKSNVVDNHSAQSYFSRNLVNDFTQIDAFGNVNYKVPVGGIYDYTDNNLVSQDLRGQLSLDKTWSKNSIAAIAGAEIRNAETNGYISREYGFNANNYSTGTVDYTNPYPYYVTGISNYIPYVNGLLGLTNRFVSLFSNAGYTYDNRYTLSASVRRDASNLFGASTNDKWTPLWSAGAGWNISNESFYKSGLLPYLKLRATYGFSGNVDQTKSGVTVISILGNSVYSGTPYGRIQKYADPDLRWERVGTLNFGLDFRTKENRLTGSFEYYQKRGIDLFGSALLDYTSGIGATAVKNIASMKGHGIDIELNSLNVDRNVKWITNLNFSTYNDQITSYYQSSMLGSNFVGSSGLLTNSGLVGKPVYAILSYRWGGLNPSTGDPRGYLNSQISKDYAAILGSGTQAGDLVYSGPALPTVFGSLGNTVTWHSFSLTARLLYKFGYYFRRPAMDYNALFTAGVGNADFAKRWQQPGDEAHTNVPSMVYPDDPNRDQFYTGSSVNVDKGDNIRIQYLMVAYDLFKRQLLRTPFTHLNIYFNISNLGIIWRANKDGLDPDYPIGYVPPARIYAVGLKGTF